MNTIALYTGKWWYGRYGVGWVVTINHRVSCHFTGRNAKKEAIAYLNKFLSRDGYELSPNSVNPLR